MAKSRNLVSTIGAQASPTIGDGTRCPEGYKDICGLLGIFWQGMSYSFRYLISQNSMSRKSHRMPVHSRREKGRYLTKSYITNAPTPTENSKKQSEKQKCHQTFDYRTTADRLRTVSWNNDSHPTGLIKPVYGILNFHLTAKATSKYRGIIEIRSPET